MITSGLYSKLRRSSLVKIILGLMICLGSVIIGQQLFLKLPGISLLHADWRNLVKGAFVSILVTGSYWLFYHKYEHRVITELSVKNLWKKLLIGIVTGSVLQGLTLLVIYLYGGFSIIAFNPITGLIIPFTVAFTVAILEEVLLRGIIFRLTEERWGSAIAFLVSGVIFAGLHLANPHVTVISTMCVLAVSLLLGAAYMYYRNLWVPIAFHFAWNFTQNGIFGAITSGHEKTSSLLETQIRGPISLTGGPFGPEGSIQAVLLCLIAALIVIRQLDKADKLIKPHWKRQLA